MKLIPAYLLRVPDIQLRAQSDKVGCFKWFKFCFVCFFSDDPVVSIFPKEQPFKAGESFSFTCETVGQYAPKITWLKSNKEIKVDARIQQNPDNVLYIADAKETDKGEYICRADYSRFRPGTLRRASAIAEYRCKLIYFADQLDTINYN